MYTFRFCDIYLVGIFLCNTILELYTLSSVLYSSTKEVKINESRSGTKSFRVCLYKLCHCNLSFSPTRDAEYGH